MNFHRFLSGPLFEEASGDPNGSGTPPAPPAPAPAAPPFDAAAFRADLLSEIRKDINGIDKRSNKQFESSNKQFETLTTGLTAFRSELEKMLRPAEPPAGDPPVSDPPPPAPNAPSNPPAPPTHKGPSPTEQRLTRELQEMRDMLSKQQESAAKATAEAEKKEMQAALKSEISRHKFATDKDPQDMFRLLVNDLQKGDDGQYYGPDGITLEELVRNEWTARPNWQPAKPVNGAGAPTPSVINGKTTFDLDRIRPNMSSEEKVLLAQAIRQNLQQ